jgi:predicted transcriptional regulator
MNTHSALTTPIAEALPHLSKQQLSVFNTLSFTVFADAKFIASTLSITENTVRKRLSEMLKMGIVQKDRQPTGRAFWKIAP